jgi:hypothetical protein
VAAKLAYIVKNRDNSDKMLRDAFGMIEDAYRADPAKYPVDFLQMMDKYLNTVTEVRDSRVDAAWRQALKDNKLKLDALVQREDVEGQGDRATRRSGGVAEEGQLFSGRPILSPPRKQQLDLQRRKKHQLIMELWEHRSTEQTLFTLVLSQHLEH